MQIIGQAGGAERAASLPAEYASVSSDTVTFLRINANPDIGRFEIDPAPAYGRGIIKPSRMFPGLWVPANDRVDFGRLVREFLFLFGERMQISPDGTVLFR